VSLYAESSAVLAGLLNESSASEVRRLLAGAEIIVTSELTLIECNRVLIRAVALGELNEAEAADRRAHLANAAARWHVLQIGSEIVDRAKQADSYARCCASCFGVDRSRCRRGT
jgi:uncharacterized protein with PIN domain